MKRKIWALLMSAALIITCLPAIAFAEATPQPHGKPVSVDFESAVRGIPGMTGQEHLEGLYNNGPYFTVKFEDGSEKQYEYQYAQLTDNDVRFLGIGEDPSSEYSYIEVYSDVDTHVFKEGRDTFRVRVVIPYVDSVDTDGIPSYSWCSLEPVLNAWNMIDKPKRITFVPAKGSRLEGVVGYNYIDESFFYGSGNAFEVERYSMMEDADGTQEISYTVTYKYTSAKHGDGVIEGFFEDGDVNKERLMLPEDPVDVVLKKGSNSVTLPYFEYVPGQKNPIKLNYTVNITANKYYAYGNFPVFEYTGKAVSKKAFAKKLVIRDSSGKKIPASAYTYKWKKHKKMGWYTVRINFKNKSKYVDSIVVDYAIGPKKPKVTSVRGGKKSLQLTWKKFTASQLKKIDGMYIEVATDKNFTQNYKIVKITKKKLKNTNTKLIKGLKGKKKYYVRLRTFKKIKQRGIKYVIDSPDSKVKKARTRK